MRCLSQDMVCLVTMYKSWEVLRPEVPYVIIVLRVMMIALVQVKSLCFDHSGTYLAVAGSDVR